MSIKYTYCLPPRLARAVRAIGERSTSGSCVATGVPVEELRLWTVEQLAMSANRLTFALCHQQTSSARARRAKCYTRVRATAQTQTQLARVAPVFLKCPCRPRPLSAFARISLKYPTSVGYPTNAHQPQRNPTRFLDSRLHDCWRRSP
jgi:hypothetical protein